MTMVTVMTTIYLPGKGTVTTVITVTSGALGSRKTPQKYIPKSAKNPEQF